MSGWEDVLLVLSEKSQSEIRINKNLIDLNFIPHSLEQHLGGWKRGYDI